MDSFAIIILLVIILSFVVVMLIMKLRYRLPWKDFFRRRLAGWKKQSRWRNPYTYMYIFIGLMLSFVMVFAIHTNHQLRTTIGEVRRENLEYHIVDAYMSRSPEYVKDRTAIHESIETCGVDSTWNALWEQEN